MNPDDDTRMERDTEIQQITDDMLEVLLHDVDYIRLIRTLTPWWIEEVVLLEPRVDSAITWEIVVKHEGLGIAACNRTSEHLISVLNYLQHSGFGFIIREEGGVYTVVADNPNLNTSN